jgi:hypothetical protein
MSEVISENKYPRVNSGLTFQWSCSECDRINYLSWGHYEACGRTCECAACEKAHIIMLPWERIRDCIEWGNLE